MRNGEERYWIYTLHPENFKNQLRQYYENLTKQNEQGSSQK